MLQTTFHLAGAGAEGDLQIDISTLTDLASLKTAVGNSLSVVQPQGLSFHDSQSEIEITDLSELQSTTGRIIVKVNGHAVRDIPGPTGIPLIGSWFEVYPDHMGNHQRYFEKYGPIFKTTNMGATNFFTNDPELALIGLAESEFFSKEIGRDHPLRPIKLQEAGVFVGDSSDPNWKVVHKFLPPALGPKAVRHYAPTMNNCIHEAFPVFDELEKREDAWNVYQYMFKLSSSTVGKIMLGRDFEHFKSVDSPMHKLPLAIAEQLAVSKKVSTRGSWYKHLPTGDPSRLSDLQKEVENSVTDFIKGAKLAGEEPLPLQDAALKAGNIIDYLIRASDNQGNRLPHENLMPAVMTATGAGFTTTSSLLSWLIYGLVTYPGMQARLLQELVDHDITDTSDISADQVNELPMLGNYVKEMQRRHNPAYQPGRTALQDMILPGGYKMKKDSVLIIALHHLHMNPKVWHDPERFDPDRWDTEEVKHRHKSAYAPFANGGRMCIGFNFALLEVKIFLSKLVYRYHWEKEGDAETEYDHFFQLVRPVNLYVRTQKRDIWPSKSSERQ